MKRLVFLILFLALAAYLATGVYQVRPGEFAVVRRFGRIQDELPGPGLHFGLPRGFEQVDRVAVDAQRQITVGYREPSVESLEDAPAGQYLMADNGLVDVRATIHFRIDRDSLRAVKDYVLNEERLEGILERAAEVALAGVLAGQKTDQVLLGQARNLEPLLQERLAAVIRSYHLGVVVESVNLVYAQPPEALAEVFREVNRARTQKEIMEREALGARQTEVSLARNQARKELAQAQAAAHDQVSRARAEAESFLALWRRYSDYAGGSANALLNLYLKEMQTILGRMQVRTVTDPKVNQTVVVPLP